MTPSCDIKTQMPQERESLATWAGRAAPPKSVVYGATELLTGEAFAAQLAELGRRSGAA